jgi:hypothetical protein
MQFFNLIIVGEYGLLTCESRNFGNQEDYFNLKMEVEVYTETCSKLHDLTSGDILLFIPKVATAAN